MRIAVFGVGELGSFLAEHLTREKHSVTLIDHSQSNLAQASNIHDVGTICSETSRWDALSQVEQREETYFLAVTGNDETNLVACDIAKSLGFKKTVARTSSKLFLKRTHVDFSALFNVDHFLSPEEITADKLYHAIHHPEAMICHTFKEGLIKLLGFNIPKEPKTLDIPSGVKLAAILRGDALLFPDKELQLQPEDDVFFIGPTSQMEGLAGHFGIGRKKIENAVIAGIDFVGRILISYLKKENVHLKIIEQSAHLCSILSKEEPDLEILNHEYTDLDFLFEEGIASTDAYIACSGKTDQNILSATLAQEAGATNVYTLINDKTYSHLLKRLGISHVISGKLSITNTVLTLLYPKTIIQSISLPDNKAKFNEIAITEKMASKTVSSFEKMVGAPCFIVAIAHEDRIDMPTPDYVLQEGQTIILVTTPEKMPQLEELA